MCRELYWMVEEWVGNFTWIITLMSKDEQQARQRFDELEKALMDKPCGGVRLVRVG